MNTFPAVRFPNKAQSYDLSAHFDRLKPADYVCECCGSSTGVRQIDGLHINICGACTAKLIEIF